MLILKDPSTNSNYKKKNFQMSSYTDLYPERRGGKISPTIVQRATGSGHPESMKVRCERDVVWNMENMPMVKNMVSALKV